MCLECLRYMLLNGVPMVTLDPESAAGSPCAEVLHFLAYLEGDLRDVATQAPPTRMSTPPACP